MNKIIDIHAHLGDIFCGQNITFRTRLQRPDHIDDSFAQNARDGFVFKAEGRSGGTAPGPHARRPEPPGPRHLRKRSARAWMTSRPHTAWPCPSFPIRASTNTLRPPAWIRASCPSPAPIIPCPRTRPWKSSVRTSPTAHAGLKIHSVLSNLPMTDPRTLACIGLLRQCGPARALPCGGQPLLHLRPALQGDPGIRRPGRFHHRGPHVPGL